MKSNGYMQSFVVVAALLAFSFAMTGCDRRPTAAIGVDFTDGEAPLEVSFTDQSTTPSGEIVAWLWDFDDGQTSEEQHPTHTFVLPGTYNVNLTVTNSHNRSDDGGATITVREPHDPDEPDEGEPDEGEPDEGEPVEGEPAEGEPAAVYDMALMGWVKTTDELILPGASVTVVGTGATTHTDSHGLYTFQQDDVAGAAVVVKIEKQGYAKSSVLVELASDGVASANFTLKPLALPAPLDADAGGEVDDGLGNKLIVPPNAFVRRDNGKSVSGAVDVHITPLDVYDERDIAAFPGEFRAVAAGAKSDDTVQLETFALADFTVMQNGADLDLAANKSGDAVIELALSSETPLTVGDEIPLWYFDTEQGLWTEEGTGVVQQNKVGQLVYRATIPHLSWWNADVPVSQTDCFVGVVLDEDGQPLAGARVESQGIDYRGASYATTNAQGEFCIDIKRGSQARLDLYLPGGGTVMVDSVSVTGVDAGANCAAGGCPMLPGPLEASLDGCVTGEVLDDRGQPIVGTTVYNNLGGTAVTDENGWFCMNTVSGVSASFFVAGRPPVAVTVIPEGDCATGGCAHLVIDVDFARPGDYLGMIITEMDFEDNTLWGGEAEYILDAQGIFLLGAGSEEAEYGCTVTVTEWEFEEEQWDDDFGLMDGGWMGSMPVALDPGAPGRLEVLDSDVAAELFRVSDMEGAHYPLSFGIFELDWASRDAFMPGDTLVYSWPGGMDIGPFTTPPTTIPDEPTVTAPALEQGITIDLDADLYVEWTPIGVDMVVISVESMVNSYDPMDGSFGFATGTVQCIVDDDGSYTIQADLLGDLPRAESENDYQELVFNIVFGNITRIEGIPLAGGGEGNLTLFTSFYKGGSAHGGHTPQQ